ncbi:coiled-coil-helix-coiled-coil-helix domain-containing protein 7 [Hylaeus volcanicus]|uniref:coiled-coil-helix-coiled-coil-helix domain-containing protein 7 n=1 Tax=Hylaeus volcanicus TaxID=313075 RepID=UPI0023B87445|nr:coiled-coil-helix-coiled-coil-helix domain-containing protein 7 [Hylaeus volcanicus]
MKYKSIMNNLSPSERVNKRKEEKELQRKVQEMDNPCLKEHYLSLGCLEKNYYVHKKCVLYFENYKNCKIFWNKVKVDRKLHGITPHLPLPEDRSKIKAEYLKSLNKL